MKKRVYYTGTDDLQGGEFALGRTLTVEGWKKQALEWCHVDGNGGLAKTVRRTPKNKLLDLIQDFWDIRIKKTDTIKKKELVDLATTNWYEEPPKGTKKQLIAYMKKYC